MRFKRGSIPLAGGAAIADRGNPIGDANTLLDCGALAILWLAAACLMNPIGDFASNDDWQYVLAVKSILKDGTFTMPVAVFPNVFLQAYWGALFCLPFGFSYNALHISTLTVSLLGILSLYGAMREFGGSRQQALIAACALQFNPIYLGLSGTFMTDVPFMSMAAISLWLFARGTRRNAPKYLAWSFAVALASILIRQFGLLLVAAFGLALTLRSNFSRKAILIWIATTALGLAVHLGFQHWLIATGRTPHVFSVDLAALHPITGFIARLLLFMIKILPYMGLFMAPLYATRAPIIFGRVFSKQFRFEFGVIALMIAIQCAAIFHLNRRMPYLDNVLSRSGVGPLTLRDTYIHHQNLPLEPSWSAVVWPLAEILGVLVGALIAADIVVSAKAVIAAIWRRVPDRTTWPQILVPAIVLPYMALISFIGVLYGIFDRYVLVMYPVLALLVIDQRAADAHPRRIRPLAWGLIAAFAAFSVPAAHDYFAWRRAWLVAVSALEKTGVPHNQIDGGYEYDGLDSNGPEGKALKISTFGDESRVKYIISSGPLPGYEVRARYPYSRWLVLGTADVVVLRRLGLS